MLKGHKTIFYLVIVLCCSVLPSCTQMRSIIALSNSTERFKPLLSDARVLCEPGSEEFAKKIAELLPEAIQKITDKQYLPFAKSPNIYICGSRESYFKLTGHKSPAVVTNKLFLSPVLIQEKQPLDIYLTHELSHLHIKQRIGRTGLGKLPTWFSEGLAEVVSGGATASYVPEKNALTAIEEGHTFMPDKGRNVLLSFLFPKGASYWKMEPGMYYRQSMLFVAFLRSNNEQTFKNLLLSILNGEDFDDAWDKSFKKDLSFYWNRFLQGISKCSRPKQGHFSGNLTPDFTAINSTDTEGSMHMELIMPAAVS